MAYVLYIIVVLSNGAEGSRTVTIHSQEFENQAACQAAEERIRTYFNQGNPMGITLARPETFCISKG